MKAILIKITDLHQFYKQLIMMFFDSFIAIAMLFIAYSLRLGYWAIPSGSLFFAIIVSPLLVIPIFYSFRLYQSVVRYLGFKGLLSIAQAVTLYAVMWGLLSYMFSVNGVNGIPRSVIFINWMLCILSIGGSRVLARWIFRPINKTDNTNIIVYGIGSAGMELSNALQLSNVFSHVAYIDEKEKKDGRYINGIPVFSPNKLDFLIKKFSISEIFLAMPTISRKKKNQITEELSKLNIKVRNMPSFSDIAEGKVKVDDLLEIKIRELLGREPVEPNPKLLKIKITHKVVLITGAGGSIGAELCRQIIILNPKKIILFEISESSLYQIESELTSMLIPDVEIVPVLGSIRDFDRIKNIFQFYNVQTVYHAAAYKHVPIVEYNQTEGVLNNVLGTFYVAKAAIKMKVETFVLISSDKAVRPTNTMGTTKRIAELILQGYAKQKHSTCFTMVRFGNVLDSSGSVIPLFKKQIRQGGPLTVTDKNIVRYFMTIPEAVELVIQAGAMGEGGDVFVLDMGEPVRIYDLAIKMIQLSGLNVLDNNNPDGDIEILLTGLRPGEKLYEELLVNDNVIKTNNRLIMRAQESFIEMNALKPMLLDLQDACMISDQEKVRELLIQIVPEFKPQSPIMDLTYRV
jgi:FlaA1/EpsC-like NDP-sugar epimerase